MSEMRISDEVEADGAFGSVSQLNWHPSRWRLDAQLERAVDHLPETVCLLGGDGEINHVSAAVRTLLSRDPWSFAGANALRYIHPADRSRAKIWFDQLGRSDGDDAIDTLVVELSAADRSWVTVEVSGRRIGRQAPYEVVCTLRAVEVRGAAATAPLSRRRRTSDGTMTRDRFARTVRAIEPDAPGQPLVIFVDVDDFANIRLAYGAHVAEDVLQRVRAVLSSLVRLDDVIGQLDDGSLAVLFRDVPDDEVHKLVRRITRGLRHPIRTGAGRVRVSASVGSARPNAGPACVLPVGA